MRFNKPICSYCTRAISLNKHIELINWDPSKLEQFSNSQDVLIKILGFSVENENFEVLKRFSSLKADIHSIEKYASFSSIILKDCAEMGHLDVVKYIMEHGADIHSRNDEAFIFSATRGHLEIVKFFVENGVKVSANIFDTLLMDYLENVHAQE